MKYETCIQERGLLQCVQFTFWAVFSVYLHKHKSSVLFKDISLIQKPKLFKRRIQILWCLQKKTDREERDIFSMVLDRRIAYLRENSCPVLSECTFSFKKQDINEADTVVIAAKRLV